MAIVVANTFHRAMGHDEEKHPIRRILIPIVILLDRKLKDEPLYSHSSFGFGRDFALVVSSQTARASIVSIVSTIEIAKADDMDGKDIGVEPQFTTGVAMLVLQVYIRISRGI
ncbi:hypothetical protein DEU56DRAFT_913553 [Suillus clintonianus]|uniref:uncharacterized protein n=1 Tax=Suillus clintonianus TaxID=1904413 RepID=UPI001B872619|nr:uncharacterized protein DEU56DRAFT_913553 [Suillus clintonianus]KAG2134770.1 hypothetical protein DEU56DRAFT_913553 [Suillus clintonianus]